MQVKTFFDFCSGIGGGRQGLEWAGLKCVGASDTSRLANFTYDLLFPRKNEKQYGNLRKLVGKELPTFDVMIAGFPCQSFSVIGRQDGVKDRRGQLIFDLLDIVEENKPKAIIFENVKGLMTHDKGVFFNEILEAIRNLEYDVIFKILNSFDFGVPHMRRRVYIIGIRKDLNKDISDFEWPEEKKPMKLSSFLKPGLNKMSAEDYEWFSERYLYNPENDGKYAIEDILKRNYLIVDTRMSDLRLYENRVPTLRAHRDGIYYVYNKELYYLTGAEALRLQGFTYHRINNVMNKVSNRHLLKQAGNAMTATVIKELGVAIKNFIERE